MSHSMNIQDQLNEAIGDERIDLVRSIIEDGADPNGLDRHNETPLMAAAECESEEILELLLSCGAEINTSGHEGNTPLNLAVDISIDGTIQSGGMPGDEPVNVIKALLNNGADLNAKNNKGETPLDWAQGYKSKKVFGVLDNENS